MSGDLSTKTNRVVGIQFTEQSLVPIVIVKAAGEQAAQIIADAKQSNSKPVVTSSGLTAQLYRIPMDHAVTPDLFPMMAALLAHVIQVDNNLQDKFRNP